MDKKFTGCIFKRHVMDDEQQKSLPDPHIGDASRFYFACRNGDIDTVKQLLPTIPFDQLNQLEPNGSTALHAATFFGHLEIVRLLLHDYGCQRYRQNRYGLTAYEETQTDEMRQLYDRPPNKNRFIDDDDDDDIELTFQIDSSSSLSTHKRETGDENDNDDDDDDDEIEKPNQQWLAGFATDKEIQLELGGFNAVKTLLHSSKGRCRMKHAMKYSFGKEEFGYKDEEYAYAANKLFGREALDKLLNEHVGVDHPDFKHCRHLLNEYTQYGTVEALLKLYSLKTSFYRQQSEKCNPLAFPLFMHLSELKQRYYQGQSYSGMKISVDALRKYRWALKNPDSVISTAKFSSTFVVRHVAERFAAQSPSSSSDNRISVLLILHFPQPCGTAIDLGKIPQHQLPCVSNFEGEHEVLIAPRTFFRVKKIEINPLNGQNLIYLENIVCELKTVLKTLKCSFKENVKKQLHCD